MFRRTLAARLRGVTRRPRPGRTARQCQRDLAIERLDARITPAATAFFSAQAAVLTVQGDGLDNTMSVSRNAAGELLVNVPRCCERQHGLGVLLGGPGLDILDGGTGDNIVIQ